MRHNTTCGSFTAYFGEFNGYALHLKHQDVSMLLREDELTDLLYVVKCAIHHRNIILKGVGSKADAVMDL